MRLRSAEVTGLFGLFDHSVELKLEDRITILFGTNGIGKTAVLRMIAGLLSGRLAVFRHVPFSTFALTFDDGSYLRVIRLQGEPSSSEHLSRVLLEVEHRTADGQTRREQVAAKTVGGRSRELADRVDRYVPYPRVGPSTWRDDTGRRLELDDVVTRFRSHMDPAILETLQPPAPEAILKDLRDQLPPVRLIETQRLHKRDDDHRWRQGRPEEALSTVQEYSRDLASQISKALQLYAAHAQDLDRTFPSRLMTFRDTTATTPQELRAKLLQLDAKRSRLMTMGFLDQEQELAQPTNEVLDERKDVLTIYANDVEAKLKTFDGLAERIELFMGIINSRFEHKELSIDREHGFVFRQSTGANLAPEDLSSGEQHELVLFYDLLFKLQPRALVLIDEPEISLHVTWQQGFLDDLINVAKLSDVDVVVATHAPEIIGRKWPLVVPMKAPEVSAKVATHTAPRQSE
jgi:predicted ATP-binding protein involved in virulence